MRRALRIGHGLLTVGAMTGACQLVFPTKVRGEAADAGGTAGGGAAGVGAGGLAGGGQAGGELDSSDDVSVAPWCKTQTHLFCSDFDFLKVDEGWDQKGETPGASVVHDDVEFKSAPYSMQCTTPEISSSSDYPACNLSKAVQLKPGGVRISFYVRPDPMDPTYPGTVWVHSIDTFEDAKVTITLNLTRSVDGTYLSEDRYFKDGTDAHTTYPLYSHLEDGKWTQVTLELGAIDGGATITAKVLFDGVVVLDPSPVTAYETTLPVLFILGVQPRGGPFKSWTVRYDNYTIDSPL